MQNMMKVVKICSKNSTNKDSHDIFSANEEKFIRYKEVRNIYKKFHFWDQKLLRTHLIKRFMIKTAAYKCMKLTSVSSNKLS